MDESAMLARSGDRPERYAVLARSGDRPERYAVLVRSRDRPERCFHRTGRRILPVLLSAPALILVSIGALQAGRDNTPSLPPSVVGQVIRQVSTAELEAQVCRLQDDDSLGYCNSQGSRFSFNPVGLQEAADYIAGQFEIHGLIVSTQTFTLTSTQPGGDATRVLTNVVGTLTGTAPLAERGTVIISAHYDSITSEAASGGPAPGADDNASGVAALLEAARLLSGRRLWHTVRFAAFAGEEQGLHGSKHFAAAARATNEPIVGVINADMIAYDGDGEPRLEIHAGYDPANVTLAHIVTETILAYQLDLLPQVVQDGVIQGSDHSSFWDQGFAAILVIEDTDLRGPTYDFNPHYHTLEDTLEKIDRTYFTEMARAIIGAATRLARPAGPDLRVVQQGPATVIPGQTVTFTLAYSNAGTAAATGVILTDTLSHGLTYQSDSSGLPPAFDWAGRVTWEVGDLDAGAGGRFVITATVLSELLKGTSVTSRATVAGRGLDADGADNLTTVEAPVRWRAYVPFVARKKMENSQHARAGHHEARKWCWRGRETGQSGYLQSRGF